MGKRNTQSRSGRSTDPSTDKAHNSVTETFESTDEWAGGQVERSPWFHKRLNELESIFKLKLLCTMSFFTPLGQDSSHGCDGRLQARGGR